MRDIVNHIGLVSVLGPQVLAATFTSAALDLADFDSAALVINTGAIAGAGDFTAKLQHSDASGSGFVDVPASLLNGTLPASLAADSVVKIGYAGWHRYLRAVVTKNGGTSIAAGAVLVKGHSRSEPVA